MGHLEDRAGLAGKVAIVAGGGGGLGRAAAYDLGRAGVRLGLCDRNAELLRETVAVLRDEGADVVDAVLDVRDPDALAAFYGDVEAAFGPALHGLVNVVGGTFLQPFDESAPKGWDVVIRTNFTWLLHSIQLALPRLRAAGGGSIVNFTSIEGHRAAPGYAVYSAMKAAVTNLGRSLALELGRDGIRINTIAPDITPTEGLAPLLAASPPEVAALSDRIGIPLGRKGTYEDIGGCVLFLVSDLGRYVTGQSLHPDGGTAASQGWFDWPGTGWRNFPPDDVVRTFLAE